MKSAPSVVNTVLAYARLLRLSNGPTAVADVWMGYAVVAESLAPTPSLIWMTIASLLLYHGGMVLNDAEDALDDVVTRPERPIPSGLIGQSTAFTLSYTLFAVGVVFASPTNVMAWMLVAAVFAYNSRYKATPAGPILMGLCRFLNVRLGTIAGLAGVASDSANELGKTPVSLADGNVAALVIGGFIVGVTWFARNEALGQPRRSLAAACCLCVAAIAWGASALWRPPNLAIGTWWLIWAIVALVATRGMVAAILQPTPRNIGRGVGIAIQGLVVIDATLAAIYAGPVAGLAILALLPITILLSRWIPQT